MRKERTRVALLLPMAFVAGLIILSANYSVASSSEKCGSNQSTRIFEGPEKLLSQLHKAAEQAANSPFFSQGSFDEEQFKYVGEIKVADKNRYQLVLLTTAWGESCRATRRLLVFSAEGSYLGNYGSLPDEPSKLTGAKLQFSFEKNDGNVIDFSGAKPLSEVRLDGELFHFDAVRSEKSAKSSTKR